MTAVKSPVEESQKREAFYGWLTPDKKAEFINGEIVVQSPAKKRYTIASITCLHY